MTKFIATGSVETIRMIGIRFPVYYFREKLSIRFYDEVN